MWDFEEREMMIAEAEAEAEAELEAVENDDDDFGGDDWQPLCDSVACYCDGPYDPMTDW